MHFSLTSLSGRVLQTDALESATVPTAEGIIGLFPDHMPLVAAIKPGVLEVRYEGKVSRYALGGGVLETDGKELRVLADMVEEGGHDEEALRSRIAEAETLMREYRAKGDQMSMDALIELEQSYLRDIARADLNVSVRHG